MTPQEAEELLCKMSATDKPSRLNPKITERLFVQMIREKLKVGDRVCPDGHLWPKLRKLIWAVYHAQTPPRNFYWPRVKRNKKQP